MSMSIDIHVKSKDTVTAGEVRGTGAIYLTMEDLNCNALTLFFPSTNDVRAFLAKALNELRQVEAGDIPFNTHKDKVEVTA